MSVGIWFSNNARYLAGFGCAGLAAGFALTFGFGGADSMRFSTSSNLGGCASALSEGFLVMSPGEEQVSFYYEIGSAITMWSHVEHELLGVVYACTERTEQAALLQAFYAIENFRSKLAFVDAIVQVKMRGSVVDRWARLNDDCLRCAKKRNQLAHRAVIIFPEEYNPKGRTYALVDWADFVGRKLKDNSGKVPSGALSLRDIASIGAEFAALSSALLNFSRALKGKPEPLPKLDERVDSPPTTRELKNRIREALGLPPPPSRKSRRAPGDAAAELERQKP